MFADGADVRLQPWDPLAVRWVGKGSERWRVRVDLVVETRDAHINSAAVARSLKALLTEQDGDLEHGADVAGVDHGLGIEERPVVSMLFWVGADDVGDAARVAVETAVRAGVDHGVGPELYDVTVIPRGAVASPASDYPYMPD